MLAAVLKTAYMWIDSTVLPRVSASRIVCALSRMTYCQSCPQFGPSTMSRCSKPLLRSLRIAAVVALVHWAALTLPIGSLPMLMTT
jgi:hypothetical protein